MVYANQSYVDINSGAPASGRSEPDVDDWMSPDAPSVARCSARFVHAASGRCGFKSARVQCGEVSDYRPLAYSQQQ